MTTDTSIPPRSGGIGSYAPLLVLAGLMLAGYLLGWHKKLSLGNIVALRDQSQAFLTGNKALSLLAFAGVYALAVACSMPGAVVLTLAGGLLFGTVLGGMATVVGATIGAVALYLMVSRTGLGETLATKVGPTAEKLRAGFNADAMSYLFFLRLVPAVPFFVVNIVAGLLNVPFRTYLIATFFGIIPATMAYSSIGASLDAVIAKAQTAQQACVAAKGAPQCPLDIGLGTLMTPQLLVALLLLGVVALIPVAYKRWNRSHVAAT
jgi:uncharacterized membrane protein YdjX (TVP38/TMEM64 family)